MVLTLYSYSNICEKLGLSNLADPQLDQDFADGEVPWSAPLRGLFERKPGPSGCVDRGDCYLVINPQGSHLPHGVNGAVRRSGEDTGTTSEYKAQALQQKIPRTEISDGVGDKDEIETSDAREIWQGAYHLPQGLFPSTDFTTASHSASSGGDGIALLLQAASQLLPDDRGGSVMNMG